jgi:hypothetical protein
MRDIKYILRHRALSSVLAGIDRVPVVLIHLVICLLIFNHATAQDTLRKK